MWGQDFILPPAFWPAFFEPPRNAGLKPGNAGQKPGGRMKS
jgi:hypothetical protein